MMSVCPGSVLVFVWSIFVVRKIGDKYGKRHIQDPKGC